MVHGYHLIITNYGTWLPNDPRGSWTDFVAAWELFRAGSARRTSRSGSLHDGRHVILQRSRIQKALRNSPVQWTGQQALDVANGFAKCAHKYSLTIWACAILPEHTHLVLARTGKSCEVMAGFLKAEATSELLRHDRHPFASESDKKPRSPWSRRHWQSYLDNQAAIDTAIAYTTDNPIREGKARQRWSFISPFQGIESNIVSYQD
jgi:REP element-mobilizing transposase RayT